MNVGAFRGQKKASAPLRPEEGFRSLRPEEGFRPPGAGVPGSCEADMGAGN